MRPSRPPTHLATTLLVVMLALAACGLGGGDTTDGDDGSPPSGGGGDTPVLVVDEGPPDDLGPVDVATALVADPGERVRVTGALFVAADGTMQLCDAIAESFPPQCGGARIAVEGLDPATVAGLQTEGDVSWAEGVTLTGSVE